MKIEPNEGELILLRKMTGPTDEGGYVLTVDVDGKELQIRSWLWELVKILARVSYQPPIKVLD